MRIRLSTLAVFTTLLTSPHPLSAQTRLTVARLYRSPSLNGSVPGGIHWAPDGRSVTFLRDTAGGNVLDLWAFDLATGRATILVRAGELTQGAQQQFSAEELAARERQRQTALGITTYLRSAAAQQILFPLSGDLYAFDLATGRVARLTRTPDAELDPKWSPDGRRVAFVRNDEIHVLETATGRETQLTTGATAKIKHGVSEFIAQEEMGRHTGYWWSPDSKAIAFLEIDNTRVPVFRIPNYVSWDPTITEQEYPRAGDPNTVVRVGVVGLGGETPRWMDLGSNTDIYIPRVSWLPDGRTLAIQRQNRDQDTLQLFFHDVATGAARLVLTETESTWVNLHDDFVVLDGGNRFLWTSERDGFNQIYLYEASGRLVRQVTPAGWDVDEIEAVDERRRLVYFTGRGAGPLERHLYVISLDGRRLRPLTTAPGWHTVTVGPSYDHFIDTHSDHTRPPSAGVYRVAGSPPSPRIGWIAENAVPELERYGLRPKEFLTIPATDGTPLHAQAVKPADFDSTRRYPVLIHVYGGPQSQLVTNSWGGTNYLWHQLLAQRGIAVVTVDNRGTTGRGRDFRRAMFRRLGQVEIEDQVAAARWLARQPWVDSTRIGIWGWSYGGYATLMSLISGGGIFRMGISVAPVTDWRAYDTHYTEHFNRLPRDNQANYDRGSAVKRAAELQGSLLLVHGDADDNVHYQQTVQLVEALQRAGKQFRFMVYPQKLHGIAGNQIRTQLYAMFTAFVEEQLLR
ncbi:MAG: DPP IV N-terminal domain-containing protein [Gemmatimonadales bacterium]